MPRQSPQRVKLTKRVVDALTPRAEAFDTFDAGVRGFHVRTYPSGTQVFALRYRDPEGGTTKRYHRVIIGTYGSMTAEEARKAAEALRAEVQAGDNPATRKATRRTARSLDDVAAAYLSDLEHERSARWSVEARRLYEKEISPWLGSRSVAGIDVADVRTLKARMSTRQVSANRARAVLSAIMTRAAKDGDRPGDLLNPARAVDPYRESVGRDRHLEADEWPRVASAITALRREFAELPPRDTRPAQLNAMLGLALTGARLRALMPRKWSDVDFAARVVRVNPPHKGVREIPMGTAALAFFRGLMADSGTITGYCFPGQSRRVGTRTTRGPNDPRVQRAPAPIATLATMFARFRTVAGLEDFTLHDWRRTFATVAGDVGLNDHQIGGLLGHVVPGVTGRYARRMPEAILAAADVVSVEVAARLGLSPGRATRDRQRGAGAS